MTDYRKFEKAICGPIERYHRLELDPEIQEMMRLQVLRQRIFCRDCWVAMGNQVPKELTFSEI